MKKWLKNHISARCRYHLNLLFFVLLAIPFIPNRFFSFLHLPVNFSHLLNSIRVESRQISNTPVTASEGIALADGMGWLQDFALPATPSAPDYIWLIITGIWLVGIIVSTLIMLLCNKNLRLIKESVKPIADQDMLSLFSQCRAEINIRSHKNILIGTSFLVKTPITVGFFKTFIILPGSKISLCNARYAMLHELAHCKNKDIQINGLMCLFQILYWFNPLVYFVFKPMRLDRELACDAIILEKLPRASHIEYGTTLFHFASERSRPSALSLAAGMAGSKPQIIKRVRHIASYTTESALLKIKSICIFTLMGLLVLCQIPLISAFASSDDSQFHFQANHIIYKDLSSFFGEFEGSFVLYDLENNLYTIHNRELSVTRTSPLSTYKIYSALIALETGVLEANHTFREWDGTPQPFESWNQDQNLASAMQNSTSWYFQELDALVGIETLSAYLSRLSYGNRNVSGDIADFWMDSSLRISPVEQVMILRDLQQNAALFEARHIETLKDVLRLSERDGAVLSGKTGTGIVNDRFINGWFIGYVEHDGRTSIFATYIKGADHAGGSAAAQITLSILEDKGIYYAS